MTKVAKTARTKLKNTKLIELNESYNKILTFFFSFPNIKISLSELAAKLGIAKKTASKIVLEMMKEGFLQRAIYGKTWIITCNQDHQFTHSRKVGFNLNMVFEAYLGGLREQIYEKAANPLAVVLFGSYRKGDDTENSDIDIAIEVVDERLTRIADMGIVPEFGYRKNVPISAHIFCRKNVDNNLFANIANGIVLEGFLEVKK
jgi:predicted nucleotidyltransferase